MTAKTLRKPMRQAEVDRGGRVGLTTGKGERRRKFEYESKESRRAAETLRTASVFTLRP